MKVTYNIFFLFIFLVFVNFLNAQDKIIIKYPSGQTKVEGYVKNGVLEDEFIEYYTNGKIKKKGIFKDCEYKTNSVEIHLLNCEVGTYLKDSLNIKYGKKHGEWISFDSIGNVVSKINFYCDLQQGSEIFYYPNGQIRFNSHYHQNDQISSQSYSESGGLLSTSNYFYTFSDSLSRDLKKTVQTKFYKNGNLKSVSTIEELEDNTEIEVLKEYYPNGFLKTESNYTNNTLNGIYREYYENGNIKSEGKYLDDEPIEKHYYYRETGELEKIEEWKDGKLIKNKASH